MHRLGSNSKVPRVRKLLLPPPLRVSGGDSLLDFPRGLLCDELCFLSRTAIGPPPNVTLVDWELDPHGSPQLDLEYTATLM